MADTTRRAPFWASWRESDGLLLGRWAAVLGSVAAALTILSFPIAALFVLGLLTAFTLASVAIHAMFWSLP